MFIFPFPLGFCSVCGLGVYDDGCVADEKVYHNKCFVCQKCGMYLYILLMAQIDLVCWYRS